MAKNTEFTKDWFVLGAITGIGATIVKNIYNRIGDRLGLKVINYDSLASGVILGKKAKFFGASPNHPVNKGEWTIGYLANIVYGMLFGVASSSVYVKTPPGNEIAKGIIIGAGWWAINLTIGNQLKLDGLTKVKPSALGYSLLAHMLYGASQGWILSKYGTKLTHQSHQSHPVMAINFEQRHQVPAEEVRLH